MAHTWSMIGKATAHPYRALSKHRKLIATIFPRSVTAATTKAPSVIENQEMLHCAASQGIDFSLLALPAGEFSYDLLDRFGRTPLHWAAEQGHHHVVLALLRAGASVDPRSQRKATPIMLAASKGHEETVGLLARYCTGVTDCWTSNRYRHSVGHWRSTALHYAAAGGHAGVVKLLLDAGFDKEQRDGAGLTPAEVSARQSHSTSAVITQLLLPSRDMGGKLVYDYVNTVVDDVATLSGLVKGGAFLNWRDESGGTPLHRAVQFRHVTMLRILLQAGADPNNHDRGGASPLHVVAMTGHGEVVADLLEAGAELQPRMTGDLSPLHLAVMKNKPNVVSLLLNAGASMEHRDTFYCQTPLSWACKGCLAPIVRVLVDAGADVESRSSAGLTPLHWACRSTDAASAEILLSAGADPDAVDLAAANDAVAPSSSRSGRSVSRPAAIDVIGRGYPLDPMAALGLPFTGGAMAFAARPLDLGSVSRIKRALHDAKRERSWRRRGWLVILANRWVATMARRVLDERATGCCGGLSPCHRAVVQLWHVYTGVEQPPCAHQKGAAGCRVDANTISDSSESQNQQNMWGSGRDMVEKKPRTSVRSVGMMTRAASRRQGQTRGNHGAQSNVDGSLSVLVDALLGLRAVEVGVFRRVVMFI